MRVAALYDVHGNLPALDAVLAELEHEGVDAIVIGGDVAAGPFPAETLERLRALGGRVRWLRGNADRELAPGEEGNAPPELIEAACAKASLPLSEAAQAFKASSVGKLTSDMR